MDGREITKKNFLLFVLPLILFFFFYPLIFIPGLVDGYFLPKLLWLFLEALSVLGLWLWVNSQERSFRLSLNPFLGIYFLWLVVVGLSTFLASPNYHTSLLFGLTPWFLVFVLFVAFTSLYRREVIKWGLISLIASASLLALIAIYQYFGVISMVIHWAPLSSKLWTPIGSPLDLTIYLAIGFVVSFFLAGAEKRQLVKVLYLLTAGLTLVSFVLTLNLFISNPKYKLNLLPWKTGWSIALETVKNKPLLGVGPQMFIVAFERYRDVGYNLTPLWNQQFTVSRNTPLQLVTETGFLGLFFWLWFWLVVLKLLRRSWPLTTTSAEGRVLSVSLALLFVYQLFFVASTFVWLLTVVFLALYLVWLGEDEKASGFKKLVISLEAASSEATGANQIRTYKSGGVVNLIVLLLFLSGIGYSGWYAVRYARAEYEYRQALQAGQQKKVQDLVTHLTRAINSYPWMGRYHLQLAQLHLNIIQNILSKKPKDITDNDRKQLQTSVQVALNRVKVVAAQVNPQDANNWVSLASVYRRIVGVAKGAGQWELASYRQAVALDPVNPILRTTLAGLLYSLNDLDGAIEQAKLAIQSKPDYANAWYNLGFAYQKKKEYQRALTAMNNVLAYLPANAPDRDKVEKIVKDLKKKVKEETKKAAAQQKAKQLTPKGTPTPTPTPSPTPTPILKGPQPLPTPTISPVAIPSGTLKPPVK